MKFFKQQCWIGLATGIMMTISPFVTSIAHAQPSERTLPVLVGIEFTQQQQAQFAEIRSQTRSQIEQVLRPEQIRTFQTAIGQGQTLQQAIAAVNLSTDQKAQLKQVFQSVRQQTAGILTPQQKQQLMQNLRARGFQRFGNR